MWTLECDGPILDHKRIWLRPGKRYLFGRYKEPNGSNSTTKGFAVSEKTVSRKHLTISVATVKPGDGSLVHTRSELSLRDESTKFGTEIDGERVPTGDTRILKNDEHLFKLGKSPHLFRIKWQPVVLSFSLSSKETKGSKDPLKVVRLRLEELDIKVILPYIVGSTTHVVQAKRNTAKGLQALINAKYIVKDTFIDALAYVTAPTDFDTQESLSPLEIDFDANWPNPMNHVPDRGKEPNERPAEAFAPNPERANVFEGYSFIFCEQNQFDTLQAPITNGGGKAVYFALKSSRTTAEELVRYIKDVAGEKGLGELEDGSEGKGVVVVRFRGGKDDFDWAVKLGEQASLALDLRFIEQNEFMDAILMNDASVLRRPLERVDDDEEMDSLNRAPVQNSDTVIARASPPELTQPSPPENAQPPPQRRQRGVIKSRFKGFVSDDDEDNKQQLSSIPLAESQVFSARRGRKSQRNIQGADSANSDSDASQPIISRKRPAPDSAEEEEGEEEEASNVVDRLIPAATAMKRRRIEEAEQARECGIAPSAASDTKTKEEAIKTSTGKPAKKEVDIKKTLRERREKEDEAARRDAERLHDPLDDVDIAGLRNLAVVEEMDIAPHNPSRRGSCQTNGIDPRWDDRWNGRKNYKKFVRQGEGGHRPRRGGQNVIVPLEEVRKKDFGIGHGHWHENGEKEKTLKRKRPLGQEESGLQSHSQDVVDRSLVRSPADDNDDDDDDDMLEAMEVEGPPAKRTRGKETQQSASTVSQRDLAGNNKTAVENGKGRLGARKPMMFEAKNSDSESEDELKFRFGKRRKV